MLFNSYIFILLFFPVTLLIYFILNRFNKYQIAKVTLIAASLIFYGYFNPWYLLIIISSILINYGFSKAISNGRTPTEDKDKDNIPSNRISDEEIQSKHISGLTCANKKKKLILILGIVINIGLIFYFKYYDFFVTSVNDIFGLSIPVLNILMPLGISFFTLQQVSYLVDSYRGETRDYSFIDYALFVSFFPQLVAGPIVLHNEMIPQFQDSSKKRINADNMMLGIRFFALGLGKKVLLADTLAMAVDYGYLNISALNSISAILVAICYSFQIYFDFSGYCDMAYGIAKCFNIDIPVNFNSPYKAISIGDFWKRWHMSLTRFLTKYIYIPLGGNRKGRARTLINIMLVFLISGIWHGAGWPFIVWGLLHGLGSVVHRLISKSWDKLPKILAGIFTFIFVTIAWVFFRSDSIQTALDMCKNIFCGGFGAINEGVLSQFNIIELTYVEEHVGFLGRLVENHAWINMALVLGAAGFIAFIPKNLHENKKVRCLHVIIVAVWAILSLAGFSKFIYFNF
ncbi:MAG: MBOAT family protein [Lachnospiraceae bacterium]|nr:MBOAT family protein [Lachnospiraceae bacterium]